ncbi:MAG TPA: dihydrofolate reductase family protein [Candidatus Tidjanibacter gallistercoris]|nr:dihydrofolate reductase family protein [Candidatus Tidjanibacter gallistercoris]
MEVIVSAAVSRDGYMDDCTPRRLVLSCAEDWAEVYGLRAVCDAILVGAETVRRDNPALVVRDAGLRAWRECLGMKPDLAKVTVTAGGGIDPGARFFTEGQQAEKIVVAGPEACRVLAGRLPAGVRVVPLAEITARGIVEALEGLGVRTLMVEGGARTIGMFLGEDAVDSLRLAVSPAVVGDARAPRFPGFGQLPFEGRAAKVVRSVGDMEVYEYDLHPAPGRLTLTDRRRLLRAVELSGRSEPCTTAYRVGCVVAVRDGREYEGYTHETDCRSHAEEEALSKARADGADLRGACVYTSLEPCSVRASKPVSCTELIIRAGAARVVYAYAEPDCFVRCEGTRLLREAGIEVTVVPEYAPLVKCLNAHILHE